ncbi:MAG: TIGR03936 family radical SAM-associated protein [Lachnospiraceae bacterium]|nr:TIGR03936 family radical SAM-associated protein [Lachnospiraceae bacterium]
MEERAEHRIRIRFAKYGVMKFTGHLDLMHFFQQLIRRSDIPINYSAGLSPHQIMSFALPLSTGLTSRGEYLDIETGYLIPSEKAVRMMNEHSVEGIDILSYKVLPQKARNAMASVKAADYTVRFRDGYLPPAGFAGRFDELMGLEELTVLKKTKKSEKIINIRPLIHEYYTETADGDDNTQIPVIKLKLSTGSVDNLKPELVIQAVYEHEGMKLPEHALLINRDEMYTLSDDGLFVSLDETGKNIE